MGSAAYIHIPFCLQKCNYCDFPSFPVNGWDVAAYISALGREMALREGELPGEVSSLFIGGGTPSLLSTGLLAELFTSIEKNLKLQRGAEVTLEANPGTVDRSKLALLKHLGVNRLSLGVQSFEPSLLKKLGRIHSAEQAVEAFSLAREAGFENINLDLMHGLPGQTLETWQKTLFQALSLKPEHLSVYGLIIEEDTPFAKLAEQGLLQLPAEELRAEMAEWTAEQLAQAGYLHYEISNYAIPGRECKHNQVYWRNLPYVGFGAGAASYGQGVRRTTSPDIGSYIRLLAGGDMPVGEQDIPQTAEQMAETMFLGLRLLAGVSRQSFADRFGATMDEVYGEEIKRLVSKGLLDDDGLGIRLSNRGVWLANEVFYEFVHC